MPLPKSAMGLLAFALFVGWLIALIPFYGENVSPLDSITNTISNAQDKINQANKCQGGTPLDANNSAQISQCAGTHWYDAVWALFSVIYYLFVIVLGLIGGIFTSIVVFTSSMLGLPAAISQIIIAIFSVGIILAFLKILIPET